MTIDEQKAEDAKVFEQLTQAVTEKSVPMILEKLKKEQPLRKEIFGNNDNKADDAKAAGAEYFQKLIRGGDTKALSSGSATNGQELVPTIVADQLITTAQNYGLIRKFARKWPMQSINENVPTMSSLSAYRLTGDTSPITSSAPTTGTVNLRAKTVGVIIPVSKTLLMNATPDVVNAITMLAGKAIARLEDQWGLLGLASTEGVFQNTSVPVYTLATGGTTYAKVTAEDLLGAQDLMDENYLSQDSASLRWVLSHSVLNTFRRLRSVVGTDKQGFLFSGFGADLPATMWDIPYLTSAVMPKNSDGSQTSKNFMSLIDFDNVIHGDRKEYVVEISDQATITDTDGTTLINLFQQNMVALKVWGQIDIQLSNPTGAFVNLKTSAT